MPTKKPTKCYRGIVRPAYTRKKYIKRYPVKDPSCKYSGGKNRDDFQTRVFLVAITEGQISEKTLATIRVLINQRRPEDSFFQFRIYPHHVARAHGVTMVKAERFVKGMRESFGAPQYRMARIKRGKTILEVFCDLKDINQVKSLFKLVNNKLPLRTRVEVEVYERPEGFTGTVR